MFTSSLPREPDVAPAARSCSASWWVWGIAGIALAAQVLTAFRYGIFRDELYYIDCACHLAWGYVDQPPLIALVAWLELHLTGRSLLSLRFLPMLAGAASVWLAGKMAAQLGGGRFAQVLAALAVLISPGYLAFFHLLTMNAFEPLLWTAAAYVVVRIIQTGDQRLWLWFGLLSGIGLENKYTILFFGFGVFAGLLLTRERKAFLKPWIWLAAAIALLIWLPNLIWSFEHHWPFLELMRHIRSSGRDVTRAPVAFLAVETMFMNPLTAPIWIGGLAWFFFGRGRSVTDAGQRGRYRVLGWTFLTMLVMFVALKGKAYYLWPGFVMLFATGGVAIESWLGRFKPRWPARACVAALVIGGAFFAPMTLPVLPPYTFIRYVKTFHLPLPQLEHQPVGPLGQQIYADMFGWKEMVQKVARFYNSLPPQARARTAIAAGNYGEAGAIDFFGPQYGLPPAISGHQTYWFWGPHGYTGESMILLGTPLSEVKQICDQWRAVGKTDDPLSRRDEHFTIYYCQQHRWTLQQIWPRVKHWN
jgi:Dolichyl-phosphate-mannose-protein mannosyltransferase